jgi:hypothetical protein
MSGGCHKVNQPVEALNLLQKSERSNARSAEKPEPNET